MEHGHWWGICEAMVRSMGLGAEVRGVWRPWSCGVQRAPLSGGLTAAAALPLSGVKAARAPAGKVPMVHGNRSPVMRAVGGLRLPWRLSGSLAAGRGGFLCRTGHGVHEGVAGADADVPPSFLSPDLFPATSSERLFFVSCSTVLLQVLNWTPEPSQGSFPFWTVV